MHSKYLIMVPYAQIINMETGVNVGSKDNSKQKEMYLKNCCVALVSAKKHNPETDVALVTNIEVPQRFALILEQAGVGIIQVPFDRFNFGEKYTWGLAFYKLCAQHYLSHHTHYDAIACIDSDTYTQADYAPVWEKACSLPMFYKLTTGRAQTGASKIFGEAEKFTGLDRDFTHYGGEFFAASAAAMRAITEAEEAVFEKMMETGFRVTTGDEFISSLVANEMPDQLCFANGYVFRFWTGAYRSISPAHKTTVVCLHVPAEKEVGMIRLFDSYIAKGKLPEREKVWSILHITHRSAIETGKYIIKKILNRL